MDLTHKSSPEDLHFAYTLNTKDNVRHHVDIIFPRNICPTFVAASLKLCPSTSTSDDQTEPLLDIVDVNENSIVDHSSNTSLGFAMQLCLTTPQFEQLKQFLLALETHLNKDSRWITPSGVTTSTSPIRYRAEQRGEIDVVFRVKFPQAIHDWMRAEKMYSFTSSDGTLLGIRDEAGGAVGCNGTYDKEFYEKHRPPTIMNLKPGVNTRNNLGVIACMPRWARFDQIDAERIIAALKELKIKYLAAISDSKTQSVEGEVSWIPI